MATITITDAQLQAFKSGMHITHKIEDPYLTRILTDAVRYVMNHTQSAYQSDDVMSLAYQRARYDYNDQLDQFDADYQSPMLNLSIDNLVAGSDEDSADGEV